MASEIEAYCENLCVCGGGGGSACVRAHAWYCARDCPRLCACVYDVREAPVQERDMGGAGETAPALTAH